MVKKIRDHGMPQQQRYDRDVRDIAWASHNGKTTWGKKVIPNCENIRANMTNFTK